MQFFSAVSFFYFTTLNGKKQGIFPENSSENSIFLPVRVCGGGVGHKILCREKIQDIHTFHWTNVENSLSKFLLFWVFWEYSYFFVDNFPFSPANMWITRWKVWKVCNFYSVFTNRKKPFQTNARNAGFFPFPAGSANSQFFHKSIGKRFFPQKSGGFSFWKSTAKYCAKKLQPEPLQSGRKKCIMIKTVFQFYGSRMRSSSSPFFSAYWMVYWVPPGQPSRQTPIRRLAWSTI